MLAPMASTRPIYLDYQATTPVDGRVLDTMLPYFGVEFGNPHSATHAFGWAAEEAIEAARRQVAKLIGAEALEIVFTSGATEANNLALKGLVCAAPRERRHIVVSAIEHDCVLESARALERDGAAVTYLPVGPDGIVSLEALEAVLRPDTLLVSIMAVNNEIGTIQPLADMGRLCRARGIRFHTDAAQAAGKIALDVEAMAIELMSLSAHKMYGPKGVGALYVRRASGMALEPLLHGGGQERGLRSGTLPTPLIVGFGKAAEIAAAELEDEAPRLRRQRDRLLAGLRAQIPDLVVNGDLERRVAGNLNLAVPGIEAEALIARLPGLALATGSACSSAVNAPSHVLTALGLEPELALSSLRIGIGRFTTDAEIEQIIALIGAAVAECRSC
jgi:cysteine desulfurase